MSFLRLISSTITAAEFDLPNGEEAVRIGFTTESRHSHYRREQELTHTRQTLK
jgi:hypothetical protein